MTPLRLFGILLTVWSGFASLAAPPVFAQVAGVADRVEVMTETEIAFPQGMTFSTSIDVPSDAPDIDAVQLLYRIGSDQTLNMDIVDPAEYSLASGTVEIDAFVDLLSAFVPVGVQLTFFWEILLNDGSAVQTADESVRWMDNRFAWEERRSDHVTLYSYGFDDDFADMMLTESQATVDELVSRYELEGIPPLTIWVYPSFGDFRGTMQGNSREAIAGVTYPGLDTILAVVPDGDVDEFGRVIPHEISHQVLFAATDNPYGAPPLWFDEGIATHTQIGGTGSFARMVQMALEDGQLFEISSLETSFPYQPRLATLAYASSWSMISYIEETWGNEGIAALIVAFGEGMSPDDAIQASLSITTDELDDAWKAWIDVHSGGASDRRLRRARLW